MGFILAASGSAIGLGNVWKFPYITGQNGGGAFVLIYLVCIFAVGLPIMLAEDPFTAVVMGCGRCLDDIDLLKEITQRA